jgi:tetratricopeptide (TPR) repeat protein
LEFSQTVSKLNKEKKYSNTLEVFKEKKGDFSDEEIANNEFLVATIVTALRHTNNSDYAFKFLEHYKITISETTNEKILNAYGWLLYSKYNEENAQKSLLYKDNLSKMDNKLQESKDIVLLVQSETLLRILDFIPIIKEVDGEFSYSVLSKLFEAVLKTESKRVKTNWQFILDFCEMVPLEKLSTDCRSFDVEKDYNSENRTVELASDQERWFSYQTKALMELGKYQECCDVSNLALKTLKKFHNSNDIWFSRRIALSKRNLGNTKEAIKELQQILRKKSEWFIQKELSELYKDEGNIESAFKLAIDAINNTGTLEFKIDLLVLLGDLLKAKGQEDLSFKHYSLSRLIRAKGEWQIPVKLSSVLDSFGKPEIPLEKLDATTTELKKYWQSPKK